MPNKKGSIAKDRGNLSRTKEYRAWSGLVHRCYHKTYQLYYRYGGRGITVCGRWLGDDGFLNFLNDMGHAPSSEHSIDRINNDGNYEPENCKWSTTPEQNRNRRTNVFYELNGERRILKDWCMTLGLRYKSVWNRIKIGWSFERAIRTPIIGNGQFKVGHKPYSHTPKKNKP